LENERSQNDEMSRRVWKAVETGVREIRVGKAKGRGSKRRSQEKERRKEEENENEKGKDNRGEESGGEMRDMG